jgi:hypothetical protein
MALFGFEPTIPVFKRAKTVHALNRAATLIGGGSSLRKLINFNLIFVEINGL